MFRQFPFVDVAFGPGQVHKLAEFLTSDSITAQGFFEFEGFTGHLPAKRGRDFQGWVQISAGCNMVCSYCIVPSTRGPRGLAAARRAGRRGARPRRRRRARGDAAGPERQLLRPRRCGRGRRSRSCCTRSTRIEGLDRIRYTSPHPSDMKEDVVRAHAELASVCEHIHLPLQSGSSRVLKRMRRTYSRERFLDRVALIREHVPDCAITTDIIVGFPGETEADFARDARGRRGGRLRRRLHVHLLAAARHRGRRLRRRVPPARAVASSAWSGSSR